MNGHPMTVRCGEGLPSVGGRPSDKNRHRFDDGRGDRLPVVLGHDDDPQRLDTSAAPSEIGSIFGCHRPGRVLVCKILHHCIRPPRAQHSLDLVPIHTTVRDHHHHPAVAARHASATHIAPSLLVPRHPVSNVAQPTPEPPNSVGQASRQVQRDDGKAHVVASADHRHMPFHHERIIVQRHHTHATDRQVNGQPPPPRRSRRAVMQRSRRSARSGSPMERRTTMTCFWVAYIVAIW